MWKLKNDFHITSHEPIPLNTSEQQTVNWNPVGSIDPEAQVEWLVPDLVLLRDVNLVIGRKQSGKSAIIASLIGQWNARRDIPARHRLKRVLWLSTEEGWDAVIKPRLMQYGLDEDQVKTLPYMTGECQRPLIPANLNPLCDFITKHNFNSVVIDPFTELKDSDWSQNDADAMRSYMTGLVTLSRRTKSTVFAMQHMRKASGAYAADDGMGSVQIANSVRHTLRCDRTEEREARHFLSVSASNVAGPSWPLRFSFKRQDKPYGYVEWHGEQDISISEIKQLSESKSKRSKMDDAKRLLLEALADGPKSAKDLLNEAKEYGIGDRTLDEAKADMSIRSNRVVDAGSGKAYWLWSMPEQPVPTAVPSGILTPPSGDDDVQLTILDLPESKLPADAQLPDAGPVKPKPKRKPKPKPEPKPEPKPKGKGKGKGTEPQK